MYFYRIDLVDLHVLVLYIRLYCTLDSPPSIHDIIQGNRFSLTFSLKKKQSSRVWTFTTPCVCLLNKTIMTSSLHCAHITDPLHLCVPDIKATGSNLWEMDFQDGQRSKVKTSSINRFWPFIGEHIVAMWKFPHSVSSRSKQLPAPLTTTCYILPTTPWGKKELAND